MRGRRDVIDRPEIAVRLRGIRQEIVGPKLAVDVQSGHDVSLAEHESAQPAPPLRVDHFDVESVQPIGSRDADEEVHKREAVSLPGAKGSDGVASRTQPILQVEIGEDEIGDVGGATSLGSRSASDASTDNRGCHGRGRTESRPSRRPALRGAARAVGVDKRWSRRSDSSCTRRRPRQREAR